MAPTRTGESGAVRECSRSGCQREVAVRLHVPWAENEDVCAAHARSLVQRDGVVAEPLDADPWE